MRSKIQLDNIKRALFPGVLGVLLSDQDVEAFANKIQERVDRVEYSWEVRVRLRGDKRPWNLIEKEPVTPFLSLPEIKKSYLALISRYPRIEEVEITEAEKKLDVYVISKDKEIEKQVDWNSH